MHFLLVIYSDLQNSFNKLSNIKMNFCCEKIHNNSNWYTTWCASLSWATSLARSVLIRQDTEQPRAKQTTHGAMAYGRWLHRVSNSVMELQHFVRKSKTYACNPDESVNLEKTEMKRGEHRCKYCNKLLIFLLTLCQVHLLESLLFQFRSISFCFCYCTPIPS